MNSPISILKMQVKSFINSMQLMSAEAKDIGSVYWKTDANTTISAVAAGTDPVTVATKLNKTEYVAGITLASQLDAFFKNQALTQADYIATCQLIRYGSSTLTTALSESVESLGSRLYQVSLDSIQLCKNANNILDFYTTNKIGTLLGVLANEDLIGCEPITKADWNAAITLVEQFGKLLTNQIASQGDYDATIAKWAKY